MSVKYLFPGDHKVQRLQPQAARGHDGLPAADPILLPDIVTGYLRIGTVMLVEQCRLDQNMFDHIVASPGRSAPGFLS
jgi:hypothetical protein